MNKPLMIVNALLWAAAIVAAAMLRAPDTLTMIVLPSLAVISLLFNAARTRTAR